MLAKPGLARQGLARPGKAWIGQAWILDAAFVHILHALIFMHTLDAAFVHILDAVFILLCQGLAISTLNYVKRTVNHKIGNTKVAS